MFSIHQIGHVYNMVQCSEWQCTITIYYKQSNESLSMFILRSWRLVHVCIITWLPFVLPEAIFILNFACYTGIHFKRCLSAEYFSVHLSVRKIWSSLQCSEKMYQYCTAMIPLEPGLKTDHSVDISICALYGRPWDYAIIFTVYFTELTVLP
jgi:hypothetical protein